MAKGHLNQQLQNIRSSQLPPDTEDPTVEIKQEGKCYAVYVNVAESGQIYRDLAARLPQQSSNGNKYILIIYAYDGSQILSRAMKSRMDKDMVKAYKTLICILTDRGLNPQLQPLENNASWALKRFPASQEIDFQLAPPHMHRRKASERSHHTLLPVFALWIHSSRRSCGIHYYLRQLDLLRQSRINPCMSAHAKLKGH
jgi:hypothetical protein